MAFVQRLLARHDVAGDVPEIDRRAARGPMYCERVVGQVRAGHHRLDPGKRRGARGVDGTDAGMRMGAAQHLSVDHSGQMVVGAELRGSRDLRHPVGTHRPGTDPLEGLLRLGHSGLLACCGQKLCWPGLKRPDDLQRPADDLAHLARCPPVSLDGHAHGSVRWSGASTANSYTPSAIMSTRRTTPSASRMTTRAPEAGTVDAARIIRADRPPPHRRTRRDSRGRRTATDETRRHRPAAESRKRAPRAARRRRRRP